MPEKETLKINFVDFWDTFDISNNVFLEILSAKYNVQICKNPDFLFYSLFGREHYKINCCRIFVTTENFIPDFNVCDYAIGFDYLEFGERYLRFPLYMLNSATIYLAQTKHIDVANKISDKKGFCSFVYSNKNADAAREYFFTELSKYQKVDSGGRFLNNITKPVANKLEFESNYKFSIAFENSSHPGYTTEKLLQSFAASTIPIYWGNKLVSRDFNAKAFINCHNYESFPQVIDKVMELDQSRDKYLEMLQQPAWNYDVKSPNTRRNELEVFLFDIISRGGGRISNNCVTLQHEEHLRLGSLFGIPEKITNDIKANLRRKFYKLK